MPGRLTVLAPMAGVVHDLAQVPDVVFSDCLVGPGCAIWPRDGDVRAPVAGRVVAARSHAVVIQADGRDVLVHLGIDTVGLGGEGFELLVGEGQTVEAGAAMARWDPVAVAGAGLSQLCPVVALQARPDDVRMLVEPGEPVDRGHPLLEWS
jgi:sugar PTS system EIIA component